MGSTTYQTSSDPPALGKTEGCYNDFDYMMVTSYPKVELDNTVCQKLCASNRFSISATSRSNCYCSNQYPSPAFRVDDIYCDNPCSVDRTMCIAYACCGSKDGAYYTVAFADELDATLELLRQLTHDYREHNPTIQSYVESLMKPNSPLQVLSSDNRTVAAGVGASSSMFATTASGLSFEGSCPKYYKEYNGKCFRRVSGSMFSYSAAIAKCQQDGASLALIDSSDVNAHIQSRLSGQAGWIGLNSLSDGNWRWDYFKNWAVSEPSQQGNVVKPISYGLATGSILFDDLHTGVHVSSSGGSLAG